ncbi:MAG: plasmid mobilization relaxosome protein MobC [Lachnospiraceae bacterium]|nr:plasmid mobilization relaxosome protein MobC [Lachnospiraceae bacterium]
MASNKVRIFVKMTPEEKQKIRERMEDAGFKNLSAYVRKMLLNGYIIKLDLSDMKEVLRLLRISSNNLNQYAKRANETGSIYLADVKELQESQKEILAAVGDILERLATL